MKQILLKCYNYREFYPIFQIREILIISNSTVFSVFIIVIINVHTYAELMRRDVKTYLKELQFSFLNSKQNSNYIGLRTLQ